MEFRCFVLASSMNLSPVSVIRFSFYAFVRTSLEVRQTVPPFLGFPCFFFSPLTAGGLSPNSCTGSFHLIRLLVSLESLSR